MTPLSRNLVASPEFLQFSVPHYVDHALTLSPAQLPWVPFCGPHVDPDEPSVFASFVALDRSDGRVLIVRGLLAEPLAIVAVTIESRARDGDLVELRAEDVRVRLGAIRDAAASHLDLRATLAQRPDAPEVWARDAEALADAAGRARGPRGRPRVPESVIEKTARIYLDLYGPKEVRKGIVQAVAVELSRFLGRPVKRSTASDYILRAANAGYLTMSGPGRAGAVPGPRLRAIDDKKEGNHG